MAHQLPELPYAKNALEPSISEKTLGFHHGKHHAAYVAKLNGFVEGTEFAGMPIEELIPSIDKSTRSRRTRRPRSSTTAASTSTTASTGSA
jgi:superoxide dismutase